MLLNKFTLIQKLRNKIRIKGSLDLSLSNNLKIVNSKIISKGFNNSLSIGKGTTIRDTCIEIVGDNCILQIGDDCIIGSGSYLSAKDGVNLIVENNCMFSRNVKIMTSDGHDIFINDKCINKAKNIIIGNNVWLADNVTILKGVEIGSDCVVGINSTLTKSILKHSIAVGNPAKVVKENIRWN